MRAAGVPLPYIAGSAVVVVDRVMGSDIILLNPCVEAFLRCLGIAQAYAFIVLRRTYIRAVAEFFVSLWTSPGACLVSTVVPVCEVLRRRGSRACCSAEHRVVPCICISCIGLGKRSVSVVDTIDEIIGAELDGVLPIFNGVCVPHPDHYTRVSRAVYD